MSKIRVLYAGLAALALSACGQTSQSSATSALASAPTAPGAATPIDAAQAPESSSTPQPIASATVAAAKLSRQACSLDTIDGSYDAHVTLDRTKPHAFRGWLEDDQHKSAGDFQIVLVGDKDFAIQAHTGIARPDVAASLKNPALADAGFNIEGRLDAVPAGEYSVRFLMQSDGKSSWCDAKKEIALK